LNYRVAKDRRLRRECRVNGLVLRVV